MYGLVLFPTGDLKVLRLVLFESSSMLLAIDCAPPAELFLLLYIFDDLLWGESRAVGDDISDTLSRGHVCTFFYRMFTWQTLYLTWKLAENLFA